MKTVNGKIKKETSSVALPTGFGDRLAIPKHIKEELDKKNLEGRWISYSKYVKEGNYHDKGWVPFRSETPNASIHPLLGGNPDGIIRRGDNILGCRPKDISDIHRADLRQKANNKRNIQKQHARELRKMARQGNIEQAVYEDTDTGSDD